MPHFEDVSFFVCNWVSRRLNKVESDLPDQRFSTSESGCYFTEKGAVGRMEGGANMVVNIQITMSRLFINKTNNKTLAL